MSSSEPKLHKVKKWLTNVTMACFFLSGGIEYSVILPTCWDYMHEQFGAEKWFYGLAISAMSISNFLVGPIMGALYDSTHQTKFIVLFLSLFEIGGNFMYFAATSKYMVLGSRFIVGLGVSAGAVLFGEIARTSKRKNRTLAFSFFMSARQVGLVIGPGLNLFLKACNFKLGHFKVDKFTSPALFMMSIWILIGLMFLFLFFQLPTAHDGDNETKDSTSERTSSPPGLPEDIDNTITSEDISLSKEATPLLSEGSKEQLSQQSVDNSADLTKYGSINSPHINSPMRKRSNVVIYIEKKWLHFCWVLGELVTEQVTFLLAVLFITLFNQQVLETGLVPLVEEFFHWNEFDVSIFFSVAGVVLLISLFCVALCTKFLSDRWLIAIGIGGTLLSYIWNISILGSGKRYSYSLAVFIIGSVVNVYAIPFVFIPAASLYSKFLPNQIQGFGQGIRRSVASSATIMGPLWAGSGFELFYYAQYYPLFGVPLFLLILMLILFVLSFRNLHHKELNLSKIPSKSNRTAV